MSQSSAGFCKSGAGITTPAPDLAFRRRNWKSSAGFCIPAPDLKIRRRNSPNRAICKSNAGFLKSGAGSVSLCKDSKNTVGMLHYSLRYLVGGARIELKSTRFTKTPSLLGGLSWPATRPARADFGPNRLEMLCFLAFFAISSICGHLPLGAV